MNTTPIQKSITLESIAESIKGLATIESVNNSLKGLATHEEVKSLQQQFTDMKTTVVSQAVDFKKHVDGLTLSIDDLPTRSELNSLEKHLEGQIDDLAISVKRGFDEVHIELTEVNKKISKVSTDVDNLAILTNKEINRVHVRLDEMDEHLVDTVVSRKDYVTLDKRVHKLERMVFA